MKGRKRTKDKNETRLVVDSEKWGINDSPCALPPKYYYDVVYECSDCGNDAIWSAKQQKNWYEELGKTIHSYAKRCRSCIAYMEALKEDQRRHTEIIKNKTEHPNAKFFNK